MNQYQFRLYLNILFKYSLSLLMLGWEVQSFKYTLLHWNFLLFRNNSKTCECILQWSAIFILLSLICAAFPKTSDWRVCGTVPTTPQQQWSGIVTAGTRWAYRTLCTMHNIHGFSTWRESSQTSWAKRTNHNIYRSAIYFNFYSIMFLCDKQQFPRNSQFSFL